MSEEELKQLKKKFISGPGHIFNPTPTSHEEAVAHGNSLAKSGNYPVGTSDCFNVGISGGCGIDCFVYLEGRCEVSSEMIQGLENEDETKLHYELYPKDIHMTQQIIDVEGLPEGWEVESVNVSGINFDNGRTSMKVPVIAHIQKIQPRRIVLEETEEILGHRENEINVDRYLAINVHGIYVWKEVKE